MRSAGALGAESRRSACHGFLGGGPRSALRELVTKKKPPLLAGGQLLRLFGFGGRTAAC